MLNQTTRAAPDLRADNESAWHTLAQAIAASAEHRP